VPGDALPDQPAGPSAAVYQRIVDEAAKAFQDADSAISGIAAFLQTPRGKQLHAEWNASRQIEAFLSSLLLL
jgi:hypothetical protein